jgi:hypothetical protein
MTTSRDMIFKGKKAAKERKCTSSRNRKTNDGPSTRFVALSLEQGSGAHKQKRRKVGPLLPAFDEARRWSLYTQYTRVRHSGRQVFYAALHNGELEGGKGKR